KIVTLYEQGSSILAGCVGQVDSAEVEISDLHRVEREVSLEELLLLTLLRPGLVVGPPLKGLRPLVPEDLCVVSSANPSVGIVGHVAEREPLLIHEDQSLHPGAAQLDGRSAQDVVSIPCLKELG